MAKPTHSPDQLNLPGIDPDLQQKLDFAKPPAPKSSKKKEEVGPPNLGKPVKVKVPDFGNPNRPKTCLEVDFPIVPVNALAKVETASGPARKRVYCMSKWWARRASTVFRAMLIAAASEAPIKKLPDGTSVLDEHGNPVLDETEVARAVWDVYYANHQKAGNFSNLRVLDCFMGGGTTLVEGSRLGFQVTGVDLNPVAWFVVKNELACTDPNKVQAFFDQIEAEVKPIIQPFYVADCPRGHQGLWYELAGTKDPADDKAMPTDFDPLALSPDERKKYRYEGPELIYTFWVKHGQCTKPGCGHRTPIFRSPVVAEKKLGVKYIELTCKKCKTAFHAELGAARMAPAAERVVLDSEGPFTELSQPFAQRLLDYSNGSKGEKKERARELYEMVESEPGLHCPKCHEFAGQYLRDVLNSHRQASTAKLINKSDLRIAPPRNGTKDVFCYLLIDPDWLNGASGFDGDELGGHPDASLDATLRWNDARLKDLNLIEIRGRIRLTEEPPVTNSGESGNEQEVVTRAADRKAYGIPQIVTLASGREIDTQKGTVPQNSHFTCGKCGSKQDLREATEASGHSAAVSIYAAQCFCAKCENESRVYRGRYFSCPSRNLVNSLNSAERVWREQRDSELKDYWPREEIPHSYMTHHANFALPKQGYTHWWKMFNSRQLLVHATFLRAIDAVTRREEPEVAQELMLHALGAWQEFSRHQCMFAFWDIQQDCLAPFFANPNYNPKNNVVENNQFLKIGRENWQSCRQGVLEGLQWCENPTELYEGDNSTKSKTDKVYTKDPVLPGGAIHCCSSSDLSFCADRSFDLVITDPPFGDNIFYSDLANFFHAWLRLPLKEHFPDFFLPTKTPNAQEALAPRLLSEDEGNEYYKVRLSSCWSEAYRVLKDGGLMAFTFHHSEDSQWAVVLESLFNSGFILEQTFPISSDDMKGEGGQFGAKGTEYDIIHVCRKRLADPTEVSWPKMRQWVKAELNRLRRLLESYRANDISDADIRVILRGKALEFYSRHYGQVFTVGGEGERETLTLRHALGGINQLLDEDTGDDADRPPTIVQPVAYQYLRLFGGRLSMNADDVSKSLFGTAIRQRDFEDHGWVREQNKVVETLPIRERFEYSRKRPRKEMKTEIDQAQFLIGGAMPGSGVNLEQELTKDTWMVRPTVAAVLDWYAKSAIEKEVRDAAQLASEILRRTREKLREQPETVDRQKRLFSDLEDENW